MEKKISYQDKSFRYLHPLVLWRARTLLVHLIKRDLLVSYKQTFIGMTWVLIKPFAMSLTIVFVFDRIGQFPDYGFPYLLIALSAMTLWEFFSNAVSRGCICIVDDRDLIVRANFPRVLLAINSALRNSIGFFANLVLVFAIMVYYQVPISVNIIFIPIIFIFTLLLNLSLSLWFGTLNVFFRDVQTLIPFLIRIGLFISPVAFTLQSVPEQWKSLFSINPLVGLIESLRYCLLGEKFWPGTETLLIGVTSLTVLLLSGVYVFGKNERKFADVI